VQHHQGHYVAELALGKALLLLLDHPKLDIHASDQTQRQREGAVEPLDDFFDEDFIILFVFVNEVGGEQQKLIEVNKKTLLAIDCI